MILSYSYNQFLKLTGVSYYGSKTPSREGVIDQIIYDSRLVISPINAMFICLSGDFRDGHNHINDAYEKGIRLFLVSKNIDTNAFADAVFFTTKDTLKTLHDLARQHRKKHKAKIIAICGSLGKTMVKEWLYSILSNEKNIVRSPKSYNSQLGVPLSVLQIKESTDFAIIEVGISKTGEMQKICNLLNPDYAICTSFYSEEDLSRENLNDELLLLFSNVEKGVLYSEYNHGLQSEKIDITTLNEHNFEPFLRQSNKELILKRNAMIAAQAAHSIGMSIEKIGLALAQLPSLAMRLETYEGVNHSLIINDTYNLDLNALSHSLSYQKFIAGKRRRVVLIVADAIDLDLQRAVEKEIQSASPDSYQFIFTGGHIDVDISNAVVLLKGSRGEFTNQVAQMLKQHTHTTSLEINFSALKQNLSFFRNSIDNSTKLLCMVKAQSYGSGLEKTALFLQDQGVNYLGVACSDEGVELRKSGVTLPILVLNVEPESFRPCILHNLEPAIYSFSQLDLFIRELIYVKRDKHPIHIKFDTGMHRLGFDYNDASRVIQMVQAQPEVYVKSVFSHLADASGVDKSFTNQQIEAFNKIKQEFVSSQTGSILFHLLNTDGIINFPKAQNDMVRLGIGMYGITSSKKYQNKLSPVFSWKTKISQIKKIKKGDIVGYSKEFIADKEMQIAIIPVGYADGFRRVLKNGKGGVYVNSQYCKTIGNICMDMTMIDVSNIEAVEGDSVEIIGKNQSIYKMASSMDTIPYEILTGISKRVHRIYIDE